MLTTISASLPGLSPVKTALRGVLEVTRHDTGETDYALDPTAAAALLDAWAAAAPYRGYTVERTGDHDWEWIYAEPAGSGSTQLDFRHWQAAAESELRLPRDRWLLGDFGVAVEVTPNEETGLPETA